MQRRLVRWYSRYLSREMELAAYGSFGRPVLLMATAAADHLEHERFLMVRALRPLLEAGRIKLYCVSSLYGEGLISRTASNRHKTWLLARYDDYIRDEVVPGIYMDCRGRLPITVGGISLGAFTALIAATKHPDIFDSMVALSGTYDMRRYVKGGVDQDFYFHHPLDFVPRLPAEHPHTALLKQNQERLIIATGSGRWEDPDESRKVAAAFQRIGVQPRLEILGADVDHDWVTWRRLLPAYLDELSAPPGS